MMNCLNIDNFYSIIENKKLSPILKLRVKNEYIDTLLNIKSRYIKLTILKWTARILKYILMISIFASQYLIKYISGNSEPWISVSTYMGSLIPIVELGYRVVYSWLMIDEKIYINRQTDIRLKKEGYKFVHHTDFRRYKNLDNIEDVVDIFLKKVSNILYYAVLKSNNESLSDKDIISSKEILHKRFESMSAGFLGVDIKKEQIVAEYIPTMSLSNMSEYLKNEYNSEIKID